jgi:hypothetical protein
MQSPSVGCLALALEDRETLTEYTRGVTGVIAEISSLGIYTFSTRWTVRQAATHASLNRIMHLAVASLSDHDKRGMMSAGRPAGLKMLGRRDQLRVPRLGITSVLPPEN